MAPGVCPGVGITSKSSSSMCRRENVPRTWVCSSTAARSSAVHEHRAAVPVRGEHGLVPVVEVLARDAAEALDRLGVGLQGADAVDQQVASLALEQEGADVDARARRAAPRARRRAGPRAATPSRPAAGSRRHLGLGQPVALDHAVVVHADQLDHVADVVVGLDPPRPEARAGPGTRGGSRSGPASNSSCHTALGKPKWAVRSPCRWPISRRPTVKRELAALAGPGLHSRPGRDLVGDLLAGCAFIAHDGQRTSSS